MGKEEKEVELQGTRVRLQAVTAERNQLMQVALVVIFTFYLYLFCLFTEAGF